MDALRAERVDGERRDEGGVDPAGEPEHDVPETVLADVVAERQHERAPHLLELRLERRQLPPPAEVDDEQVLLEAGRARDDLARRRR